MKKINLIGKRFGRLIVLKEVEKRKNGRIFWGCKCDCGKTIEAMGKTLLNGGTKSCGCLHIETSIKKIKKVNQKNEKPIGFERETSTGYIDVKTIDGWKRKHVHILEVFLGRCLEGNEIAHHCDGNKKNNSLSNIELMLHGCHSSFHNKQRCISEKTKEKISESNKKVKFKRGHLGRKLQKDDVLKIKEMLSHGYAYGYISGKFNVSKGTIAAINQGKIWVTIK